MQLWPWAEIVYPFLACLIVAGVMALSLACRKSSNAPLSPPRSLLWYPLTLLVQLGEAFSNWDTKISLLILDGAMSSLDTLGAACIDFESLLVQISQSLVGAILTVHTLPKRLNKDVSKK